MKYRLHFFVLLIFCAKITFSQTQSTITWPLSDPASGGTGYTSTVTGNLLGSNETFKGAEVNGYTGLNGSQRIRMAGTSNSWAANINNEIDTVYVQFSVSPKSGFNFLVSSISLSLCAASSSAMKANVYYSLDPSFVNKVQILNSAASFLSTTVQTQVNASPNITVPDGKTIYIRIYPWYQSSTSATGKYVCIQNVVVSGITSVASSTGTISITTSGISGVTYNSAKSGGNVLDDGGDAATAKGVCWNTSGLPTISDSKTNDGTGLGAFISNITGLKSLTKYFVRAYATNSKGTFYGGEFSFTTSDVPKLAFPSAEGFGRFTTGGRGGVVYEVTNLNDDNNPGSLRYAINQTGARTIVFKISGTIFLKSSLSIRNGDLTIAGQTAPGDGICVAGYTTQVNASNVIIRFIRFRLGDINKTEDDAFGGRNQKDIIIDHCSVSWSVDEDCSFYDNENFTLQWCLLSESLYYAGHVKGAHGYGGIWGGMNATFHHNLLAHHTSRNPRFCGARYHQSTASTEIVDHVNNVIYNWGFNSAYGGELGQQNVRANYYKPGPATKSSVRNRVLNPSTDPGTNSGYGKFYVTKNFVDGSSETTNDNWGFGVQGVTDAVKNSVKVDSPFPIADISEQSAADAYNSVLKYAGAYLPKRDQIDARIINEVKTGTVTYGGKKYAIDQKMDTTKVYGIIDSQNDVGGWPTLNSLPAPTDSDHDGMPDDWETAHGLNPNNANDRNVIAASGYTMLEEYVNGIVSGAVTSVEQNKNMPAEFKLEQNYPNPFNPSTTISYQLSVFSHTTLKVYDLLGREVATLVDEYKQPGNYNLQFSMLNLNEGGQLSSGIYFYVLRAGNFVCTKKMILMK